MLITLLKLPFLPVQAVVKLAEVIADEVNRDQASPASVRRRLEAAAEAREAGLISAEQLEAAEREAVAIALPADSRPAKAEGE
jgi:hypothetical protein